LFPLGVQVGRDLASRRRLVQAQDFERQRLERNLHDGAQQQLVALAIQLSLLEGAAEDPGEVRELTGQLRSRLQAALEDLRALARGIYPPLLADQGLAAALRAQASRVPVPVSIEADGIGRYPREAEAAVYFCALEALQNVAKHAHASRATITLSFPIPASSPSPSPTTARASTPRPPHEAPACKAWPTGWPRWAAHSSSAPNPGPAQL
jgi:signal transduction histidine kinase